MPQDCIFCRIVAGEVKAAVVYEDEHVSAFLDNSPLFAGHCLVCPKQHFDTLIDVPREMLVPLFSAVQLISRAVESGLGAGGSLIAVNTRISQSVPHLHVHVIPRRRGDGLKGFFWPRRPYSDASHMEETRASLERAVSAIRKETR